MIRFLKGSTVNAHQTFHKSPCFIQSLQNSARLPLPPPSSWLGITPVVNYWQLWELMGKNAWVNIRQEKVLGDASLLRKGAFSMRDAKPTDSQIRSFDSLLICGC